MKFSSTACKPVKNHFDQADFDRVEKFFKRDRVYKQLKAMVSFLIPDRSDVKLILKIGGESYTDGNSITVGLPKIFIKSSLEEIFIALQALTGHEGQHINSSDFKAYMEYQKDVAEKFVRKYPHMNPSLLRNYMSKISIAFGNGVEDGRIEKILGNKLPGYVEYLQFLNGSIWKSQEMKGNSELEDFLNSIVTYAVTGLNPKGFDDVYKGTELEKNLNKLKPMIMNGINAVSCRMCLTLCKDMITAVEPYLVELLEERTQYDEEFICNLPDQPEFTTSSEKDFNTNQSISIHFKPEKKREDDESSKGEEEEKEKKSGSESKEEKGANREKEADQEEGSGASKDGDSEGETDNKSASDTDSKKDVSDEETCSDKQESGGYEKTDDESEKEMDDSFAGEGNDADSSEDDTDIDSEDSNSDSEKDGEPNSNENSDACHEGKSTEAPDEEEPLMNDENLVTQAMDDLLRNIEGEVKDKISEEPKRNKKEELEKSSELDQDDLREIENKYKRESIKKFHEVKGFPFRHALHRNIKQEGKKFRKEVQAIFRNKEGLTLRGQKRGAIDVSNLYKIGTKDFNVFVKRGIPSTSDFVAYLLWDGSGSMFSDNKQMHSGFAMGVAEEGLKGIIPFKVAQFSVDSRKWVTHYVVKDFNENEKSHNYTYNFLHYRQAGGGNKDGYSIRVATRELMKRSEKDRILVIFSDGLPSDYDGGYKEGILDVKEAVKEARTKGIFVVSILFGTESFRDKNIEEYKYMYEKNIISCDPSQITTQLIRMLKKVIAR
ncbi:hypothetical protein SMD22_01695 (plasmid) [Brevibacillus halotolerans]|nr:hypothetical protein SMD22_01695 [Brevibacillus halotolerans]